MKEHFFTVIYHEKDENDLDRVSLDFPNLVDALLCIADLLPKNNKITCIDIVDNTTGKLCCYITIPKEINLT